MLFSYTVCTGIAIAFGLMLSTFVLGFIMSTKWYAKKVAKITRQILLSDEYNSIMKEIGKRAVDIGVETFGETTLDDYNVEVKKIEDVD